MDFGGLTGSNCGQVNSLVQLTQHVTQDLTFQESVSTPFASGLDQNDLMPPQSFRLTDLMGELQNEEPLADFAQNPWATEFQTQINSEEFPVRDEMQSEMYEERIFNYGNFHNFSSPDFQYHVPQNFNTVYPQIEYELEAHHQSEEFDQAEESYEKPPIEEAQSEQKTEEICCPLEPIVEFDDPQKFCKYLAMRVTKYRKQQWEQKNPTKKSSEAEVSKEVLISDTKRYSHNAGNPFKNHPKPYEAGCEALGEEDWMKAALYFDEAVRQDDTDTERWVELSFALLMCDKPVLSLLAAKELLKLNPGSLRGNMIACDIYKMFDCDYQACQSLFNWLKYNEKYNFLIPKDFEMYAQSNTTELERHQFKAVLNLFCKAARQNPTGDIDEILQVVISELLYISGDFEKRIDCIRTTLHANPMETGTYLDLGAALFQNGNIYEALDAYMSAFESFINREKDLEAITCINKACTGIGLVHMYLKMYKEASNWFMRVLTRNYDFKIEGNCSLEGEYDLCLRLYLEVTDIVK